VSCANIPRNILTGRVAIRLASDFSSRAGLFTATAKHAASGEVAINLQSLNVILRVLPCSYAPSVLYKLLQARFFVDSNPTLSASFYMTRMFTAL
jgi:hypothetical protein